MDLSAPSPLITAHCRLATGVNLEYVEMGDPAGLPVVMLHGVTDSWRSFAPVLPHLPPSLHVFALSQRGHGGSDKPAGGYRTQDFADDVRAFADAQRLPKVLVVGHSMGTSNAMRFAIDHPDRCLGLVLLGAFARYRANPGLVDWVRDVVDTLADPVPERIAREFQEGTVARPIPRHWMDGFVAESLKLPARVWRDTFAGFMGDALAPDLPRVRVPTLLLHGAHDSYATALDQDELLAAIAGARLLRYADAGHALHWEEPARCAADIAAFAARLAR